MKPTKCASIVRERVDMELSKLEYGELQRAKSLTLAIAMSFVFFIIKLIERVGS